MHVKKKRERNSRSSDCLLASGYIVTSTSIEKEKESLFFMIRMLVKMAKCEKFQG